MGKSNSEQTYHEIYGQPESFEAINSTLPEIRETVERVFSAGFDKVIFTGCGTSLYLAQSAAHVFTEYTGMNAEAFCCSELYYFPEACIGSGKVLVIPITRKSYTTEVRRAIDRVHQMKNVTTLAVTCDKDSSTYNDAMVLSPKTDEESVIMTRSFTSMLYLMVVMAACVGKKEEVLGSLSGYGKAAEEFLKKEDRLAQKIISEHPEANLFISLGQGVYYGVANECMNKMKEMGLTNSEAYYTMEYRHGPMSLVDGNTFILFLCHGRTKESDKELLKQMKGYGAITAAIGGGVSGYMGEADYVLDLSPDLNDELNAPLSAFIGQFLGYYIAEKKNIDADTPRHLSQAIVIK